MGKSSKKKKRDADFVKPKLKVGKKKPSATNFTNTAFKSSAINVQAQLEEKSEPTNRKNLSLKDILHQINHYNDNTRQDATESLKNFFIQYPSSLHQNLNIFLPKLLGKSVDVHFNVRKNFILCLEHVFQTVTSSEIQPFFPVIMAHLSCAMTHINEEIQADSLKFMDLCLDMFPALFLESCEKVFHNFLAMVYQSQGPSIGAKVHSKIRNTKVINQSMLIKPIGKLSSAKTRKDVLEKLLKIVALVFKSNNSQSNPDKMRTRVGDFLVNQSSDRFILFKYKCLEYQRGKQFSNDSHGDERELIVSDRIKSIRSAIISFVPVLFECWNDCRGPDITHSNKGNDSTLQIMTSIASILRGIASSQVESNEIASFTDAHLNDFKHFCLEDFPFSFSKAHKKSAKHNPIDTNMDEVILNSFICEVYCKMISSNQSFADLGQLQKVVGYVKSLSYGGIMSKVADSVSSIRETVCTLVNILMKWNSSRAKGNLSEPLCDILRNLTLIYKESRSSSLKLQLLSVLEHLLQLKDSLESQATFITQILETWLNLLPCDLESCNPENSDFLLRVMAIISTIITQKLMPSDMGPKLHHTINHVIGAPNSIFTISTCELSVQRKFLEIIYFLPQVNKDLVKSLSFLCHCKETSTEIKSYVCHILYYCLLKNSVDLGLFLSFVLSVVVGSSWANLENIQSSMEQNQLTDTTSLTFMINYNSKSKTDDTQAMAEHVRLCEVIIGLTQAFEHMGNTLEKLLPTLDHLLLSFHVLPDITVVGLLTLIHRLQHFFCQLNEDDLKPFCDKLAGLMFSVVVYRCFAESNRMEDSLWSKSAFGITCDLLRDNDHLLHGWVTAAVSAIGSIDDDVIAGSLRSLMGQPMLRSKLEHIFSDQIRTTQLRKLYNEYANSFSI